MGGEVGEVESFNPGAILVCESRGGCVKVKRLGVIYRSYGVAGPVEAVVIISVKSFAVVDARDVVIGNIRVSEVAGALVNDLCAGGCVLDCAEDGLGVGCGRIAVVVTKDHACVVGVRTYYCNGDVVLAQRQDIVIVLKKDDGLAGSLLCEFGVSGAAEVCLAEVCPRKVLCRVEHAELEARGKDAAYVHVDVGLGDESLRYGVKESPVAGTAFYVGT